MSTDLETFISNHISTINKNNIIYIDLGKIVSQNIFTNNHREERIHAYIHSLEKTSNVTIEEPLYIKSYFANNTVLEIYPKKISNYSYTINNNLKHS